MNFLISGIKWNFFDGHYLGRGREGFGIRIASADYIY